MSEVDPAAESCPAEASRTGFRRAALAGLWGSAALGLALGIVYAARFDGCAALTVFPVWAWLVPGLALAAPGWRQRRRGSRLTALVWLGFLLAFAEEPGSLLNSLYRLGHAPRGPGGNLRVVSLNCDIGSPRAAGEVVAYRPDVVLFQESPGRPELEAIAARLGGGEWGVVAGPDASIVVRGRAVPVDLPPALRSYFVEARVSLASGPELEVFSTRLVPAIVRLDLWSPACWREQAANRRKRRDQLRALARRIASLPADLPVLVGGDFNAPQGDGALRVLGPRLHDLFGDGGRGWGNTIVNDFPCVRIDQVWAGPDVRGWNVEARKTRHSDHRMVVADLIFNTPRAGTVLDAAAPPQ